MLDEAWSYGQGRHGILACTDNPWRDDIINASERAETRRLRRLVIMFAEAVRIRCMLVKRGMTTHGKGKKAEERTESPHLCGTPYSRLSFKWEIANDRLGVWPGTVSPWAVSLHDAVISNTLLLFQHHWPSNKLKLTASCSETAQEPTNHLICYLKLHWLSSALTSRGKRKKRRERQLRNY